MDTTTQNINAVKAASKAVFGSSLGIAAVVAFAFLLAFGFFQGFSMPFQVGIATFAAGIATIFLGTLANESTPLELSEDQIID